MLSNKAFDVLKYIQRHLPAVATFYTSIALALNLPYADEVEKVICAVATLMAALLDVSTIRYNQQNLSVSNEAWDELIRTDAPNEDVVDHHKSEGEG